MAALVAAWLAVRPYETHEADAMAWLEARPEVRKLKDSLRRVLIKLWAQAYKSGLGATVLPDQKIRDRVNEFSATWVNEVTQTRVKQIAAILAAGGTAAALQPGMQAAGMSAAAALAAAILAFLKRPADALRIAVTETYRAANLGALDAYRRAGVRMVRWVTRSGHPCPVCIANEAAGALHLGEPFPSGDQAPPAHPNCECVLVPA